MDRLTWLEEQLEEENLPPEVRRKYESEAEHLAESLTLRQDKERELKVAKKNNLISLRTQLLAGDLSVVDTHGIPEFGDDYEVVVEGVEHIVYSKVAREWQDTRRVHTTAESADSDYRYLIYNRLYDRYVRAGDTGSLDDLLEA